MDRNRPVLEQEPDIPFPELVCAPVCEQAPVRRLSADVKGKPALTPASLPPTITSLFIYSSSATISFSKYPGKYPFPYVLAVLRSVQEEIDEIPGNDCNKKNIEYKGE